MGADTEAMGADTEAMGADTEAIGRLDADIDWTYDTGDLPYGHHRTFAFQTFQYWRLAIWS